LEAHVEQQLEHARLAIVPHRVDQRLVAITQVDGAPDRRLFDDLARPGAVGNGDLRVRPILLGCVWHANFGGRGLCVHGYVSSRFTRRSTECVEGAGPRPLELRYGDDERSSYDGRLLGRRALLNGPGNRA